MALFDLPGDADARRRGRTVIVIVLVQFALLATALPFVLVSPDMLPPLITIGFSLVIFAGVLALARSGRVEAAALALVGAALTGVVIVVFATPGVSEAIFYLILPILIAGIVLRPWQVWPVVLCALAIVFAEGFVERDAIAVVGIARSTLVSAGLIVVFGGGIGFVGAGNINRAFRELADAQAHSGAVAQELANLNAGLESQIAARTAELRGALDGAEARTAEKQELLEELAAQQAMIREMSVPVLPVREGTLVLPLVGALDSGRLADLQSRALGAVEQAHAHTLLLDITGVPVVDTQVARGLIETIQAARLLGAEPRLIGVRPEVAQTLVALGIDLTEVRVAANLENALVG
jgi:rsbT co-antagonist protein RsbR